MLELVRSRANSPVLMPLGPALPPVPGREGLGEGFSLPSHHMADEGCGWISYARVLGAVRGHTCQLGQLYCAALGTQSMRDVPVPHQLSNGESSPCTSLGLQNGASPVDNGVGEAAPKL